MKTKVFRKGRRFVRLRVISNSSSRLVWVQCDCGTTFSTTRKELESGGTTQCVKCRNANIGQKQTLTRKIWPRVCRTCKRNFTGTAGQKYCAPTCRPANRVSREDAISLIRSLIARYAIAESEI